MKVIFLDIDGVLNRLGTPVNGKFWLRTCPDLVQNLNRITDATGAFLVLSSSARRIMKTNMDVVEALASVGITGRVKGKTPSFNGTRGSEIKAWLAENKRVTKFCILDDEDDMDDLLPFLFQTKNQLNEEITERVISYLGVKSS